VVLAPGSAVAAAALNARVGWVLPSTSPGARRARRSTHPTWVEERDRKSFRDAPRDAIPFLIN